MTSAEFFAAACWPVVAFMAVACAVAIKKGNILQLRYVLTATIVTFFGYAVLGVAYPQSSIIAIWDSYGLGVFFGLVMAGGSVARLVTKGFDPKTASLLPIGLLTTVIFAGILYQDFFLVPLVLEGRVERPRIEAHYRGYDYLVDIAGHTVKATTPVYERLGFKPYVRAEIARGSNYISKIEYLTN
jgi:hypothetical protein